MARLIRELFRLFGPCRHDSMWKERRGEVLHLVCDRCGYAVPVLRKVK